MRPIHPFPARMAPEIALKALSSLPEGSTVLDPMTGSGTVLREAVMQGHQAYGYDLDPLAVLISKVWTKPVSLTLLNRTFENLMQDVRSAKKKDIHLNPIIFKRDGIYYCRMKTPSWLWQMTRRKQLKFSLRTRDFDVALYRSNLIANCFGAFLYIVKTKPGEFKGFGFEDAYAEFIRYLGQDLRLFNTYPSAGRSPFSSSGFSTNLQV